MISELEEMQFNITKWLACVYRSLDELQSNDAILEQIQGMPIIPLANGEMVRLEERTVFFPFDREDEDEDEQQQHMKRKKGIFYFLISIQSVLLYYQLGEIDN